jgi:hypothetical protein
VDVLDGWKGGSMESYKYMIIWMDIINMLLNCVVIYIVCVVCVVLCIVYVDCVVLRIVCV